MHKDGWYFFGTFQPPIIWCEKGKKFAVFIMSARYSREISVYKLIHLIKNARGAVFIQHMCIYFQKLWRRGRGPNGPPGSGTPTRSR